MLKFSSVYIETSHVCLVGDTEPHSFTEHGLVAVHVVVHNVLQIWKERLRVYQIEVDLLISGDLDSDVTFDEEKARFPQHPQLRLLHSARDQLTKQRARHLITMKKVV